MPPALTRSQLLTVAGGKRKTPKHDSSYFGVFRSLTCPPNSQALVEGPFSNQTEPARHLGVSRLWVSRVLKGLWKRAR